MPLSVSQWQVYQVFSITDYHKIKFEWSLNIKQLEKKKTLKFWGIVYQYSAVLKYVTGQDSLQYLYAACNNYNIKKNEM